MSLRRNGKGDSGMKNKQSGNFYWEWTREPAGCSIEPDRVEITTAPHTDLWQRTYYHFRNDNAPVLQMETEDRYFSFGSSCIWIRITG